MRIDKERSISIHLSEHDCQILGNILDIARVAKQEKQNYYENVFTDIDKERINAMLSTLFDALA